jgi:hypothetical protein
MLLHITHPYVLNITYYEPIETTTVAPTFTSRGTGFAVVQKTQLTHLITRRYPTEAECIEEIEQIETKQKQLDKYMAKMRRDILIE